MKINFKKLLFYIAVPLLIGGLSGFLIRNSIPLYAGLNKPPLSPPAGLFPIVWTALYLLMGVSSYFIGTSGSPDAPEAMMLYRLQLLFNFVWPLIFFNLQSRLPALIILAALWILVFRMVKAFYAVKPLAGLLQIPYLVWLTFAFYLNAGAWWLNK